jgi:hypothetical protein
MADETDRVLDRVECRKHQVPARSCLMEATEGHMIVRKRSLLRT